MLLRVIQRVLHQPLADALALRREIDGDRADASGVAPHVHEVRAARRIAFEGGGSVDRLLLHQQSDDTLCELDAIEVGREAVRLSDVLERLVADASEFGDVLGLRAA